MALSQGYHEMWFESFYIYPIGGRRDPIQLKLVKKQDLAKEIINECASRPVDPYALVTECSKNLFYDYPVGTKFFLKAKLTDRRGSNPFFYTNFNWPPLEIVQSERPGKEKE